MSKDLKAIIKEKLASGVSMDDLLTEISDTINDTNDELTKAKKEKEEKMADCVEIARLLSKYLGEVDAQDVYDAIAMAEKFSDFNISPNTIFKFKI